MLRQVFRQCGLCRRHQFRYWWRANGYDIGRCRSCGLVQVLNDISIEELQRIYGEGFYNGENEYVYKNYLANVDLKIKQFGNRLDSFCRVNGIAHTGNLLEIGCAHGLFLQAARLRGWTVQGTELSQHAADWARNHYGLNVNSDPNSLLHMKVCSYDLVVMWDVIEHVKEPAEILSNVKRVLKPGGRVVLATGDIGSLGARFFGRKWYLIYPPYHLFYFDHRSIRNLLEKVGLSVTRIENTGGHPLENKGRYRLLQWIAKHDRYIGWRFNSGPVMEVTASAPPIP